MPLVTAWMLALPFVAEAAAPAVAPMAPIVADGTTVSTIQVLIDDPTAKVRVKAEKGKVTGIEPVPGGVIISFVPPAVTEPGNVLIELAIRSFTTNADLPVQVPVVPGWTAGFTLTLDPPNAAPGTPVTVKVTPTGKVGIAHADRNLLVVASTGTASAVAPASDGTWITKYTPPATLTEPGWAVVAVVDAAAPWESFGHVAVPLAVKRSLTFDAPPEGTAVLEVGGREYGPQKASPSGKVAFDVILPPTLRKGKLTTVAVNGARTTKDVDLPVKPTGAVALGPLPKTAPAGNDLGVLLFCRTGEGVACGAGVATPAVTGGLLSPPMPVNGAERVTWTLPTAGVATVSLGSVEARATATVGLAPAPVTVSLSADPPTLAPGKKDFTVTARVKDLKGTGVVGKPPIFAADGATAVGKVPKDNKDGSYTLAFKLGATPKATVRATPVLVASGLPVRRLMISAGSTAVWADGTAQVSVLVIAEDALGLPVPNVTVTLSVPMGDGALAPTVTTGPDGVARTTYRVGTKAGAVGLVAEARGFRAATSLWQTAPNTSAPQVRATGSPQDLAARDRWLAMLANVAVEVGAAPAVATGAVAPPTSTTAPPPTMTAAPTVDAASTPTPSGGDPGGGGAPNAPRVAGNAPWLRAHVRLVDAPFFYNASYRKGDPAVWAPAKLLTNPILGGLGVEGRVELWAGGGPVGVDVRLGTRVHRLELAEDDKEFYGVLDFHAGGRFAFQETPGLKLYGGLAFERTNLLVFKYTDASFVAANATNRALYGGRLAMGLQTDGSVAMFRVELAETFTPLPSHTRLDIGVDVPLQDNLAVYLGGGLSMMHAGLRDEDVRFGVFSAMWDLGAGITLMAF